MKSIIKTCLLLSVMLLYGSSASGQTTIVLVTDFGDIEVLLYDNTPQHRDNFIKLSKESFYDSTLFHRVIKAFMVQGGDPDSKNAQPGTRLGMGGPGYTVPAEILPENIHKRGALAAARTNNPEKASSGSQFYIVQGKVLSDDELNQVEVQVAYGNARPMFMQFHREEAEKMQNAGQTVIPDSVQARAARRANAWVLDNPYKMPDEIRQIYKTIGGTPHLDGEYTVFGEVIKGMEIVDKITDLETDIADRPKTDVRIKQVKVK